MTAEDSDSFIHHTPPPVIYTYCTGPFPGTPVNHRGGHGQEIANTREIRKEKSEVVK